MRRIEELKGRDDHRGAREAVTYLLREARRCLRPKRTAAWRHAIAIAVRAGILHQIDWSTHD